MQAAFVATTIAEFFRDQGQRVLLIVDSVTRLARALREIGLSAGEPPTRRGFPPSVFAMLPLVFERAGPGERGTITAIYTVLVEGEASADPVAEETRSLLDGHIVLSDKLAAAGHYPAIDILESRSRLMDSVTEREHRAAANRLRELVAKHREIELLVQVGEYRPGQDAVADEALARIDAINAFLKQGAAEPTPFGRTVQALRELTA
jgi:type III secretion protein N (ATPase)